VTMIFGSFVAGATPQGGGAVAFPGVHQSAGGACRGGAEFLALYPGNRYDEWLGRFARHANADSIRVRRDHSDRQTSPARPRARRRVRWGRVSAGWVGRRCLYVSGRRRIARRSRSLGSPSASLSADEVGTVVRDAAHGAHTLHEAGIAHRDIKPDNIMITRSNGTVQGHLADLGLAQIINPGQTATGIGPVGTIEYLAPELVQGQIASRASDVWALGISLHRGLTGNGVYSDLPQSSLLEALRYLLGADRHVDPSLSEELQTIVGTCLAENPADRFGTAQELADALGKVDFDA